MISSGMIGFVGSKHPGFLQKAIMLVTGSKWSHCFFLTEDHCGVLSVQEASWSEQIVPFHRYRDDPDSYYEIYELTQADPAKLRRAIERCYEELAGLRYNGAGLPWHIWRRLNEFMGRDIRHEDNWVNDGIICSQSNYYLIEYTGDDYSKILMETTPWTVEPRDIYKIVEERPDLFSLSEQKT